MKKNKFRNAVTRWIIAILVLPLTSSFLFAQAPGKTVGGYVVDSAGAPIIGASVLNVSTGKGTFTGQNGNFSVKIIQGQKLQVSYIGFQTKLIEYMGQENITVSLIPNATILNDVVVIGYGTQRKEAVTGSVASISGNSLRDVPSANVSSSLQGRVPGVAVSPTSSQPGAAMQIRIRGTRSLTANNDPLIVLDGIPFPGNIGDIDPNDIKSLDILKDASATAIYGSRGANGVILITTNKGIANQDPRINYNGYFGLKKLFAEYPMMNGPQILALRKAAGIFVKQDGSAQLGSSESDSTNTDWQKLVYQNGMVTNHDISVSAGTKGGSYNFGAAYYQDQSVIPTQYYKRYSLHGSIDQAIGKHIKIGFTTNSNYNYTQGTQVQAPLGNSPLGSPYNADGSIRNFIQTPQDQQYVLTKYVIDSLKNSWLSQSKGYASYNSVWGEVNIPGVEGLKYRINVGLNFNSNTGGSYTGVGVNSTNPTSTSSGSISHSWQTDWTIENILSYDRTFKEKHHLDVTALYSTEKNSYNNTYVSATNIPADALQYYNLGLAPQANISFNPANQGYAVWGLLSWMGRVMYSYEDKYMISATMRSDGSSRLASGHKWHTYPAISAGWNIANESFVKDNIKWLDQLKFRVGYGQTSNQAVAPYSTLGALTAMPYNFGAGSYSTGYYLSSLANPNLGWEFSKTYNFGLDFALFNNRLTGTAEYYITKTDSLLESVNLPATTGVATYTANVGKTQNKGVDLSLNGIILQDPNGWSWSAGVNISFNKNQITYLNSGVTEDQGNDWFVGHPVNVIYDYQKIGLWKDAADSTKGYEGILQPGGNVGMIKVKYTGGYNADGTPKRAVTSDDRQIMQVDPNFTGGFNTMVSYKGFDLTVVGIFQGGGMLVSTLYGSSGYQNLLTGRTANVNVDYWTPNNTNAKYPKPGGEMSSDNPIYGSTLSYFKNNYLKIQTMTLGYNFTKASWMKSVGVTRCRLYFTAQNPFVFFSPFHSESGLDPETNSYADQNTAVASYPHRILTVGTNTPATRNYIVGLNLTF